MSAAVIFDLDGTLVDTPAGIVDALGGAVVDLGWPRPSTEELRATIGRPMNEVLPELLGNDDPDLLVAGIAAYRRLYEKNVLVRGEDLVFDGVVAGLTELRARGVAVAIATSKIQLTAAQTLDVAGLARFFDVVVCHDMVSRGKPYPDLALAAAGRLGVDPADCAMVGDTRYDIQVGVSAGMVPIGVSYGVGLTVDLLAAGAALVADTFAAVVASVADDAAA